MPYLKPEQKERIRNQLHLPPIAEPGELNFLICEVVKHFLANHIQPRYADYNDVLGALEGAKLEVYRRLIAVYEDGKIAENGDVF